MDKLTVGDVLRIRRGKHISVVIVTNITLRFEDEGVGGSVSFRLAQPGEDTITGAPLFLFREWMKKVDE